MKKTIANRIDHTNLKPDATLREILKLCQEAQEHEFGAVCVHSSRVQACSMHLQIGGPQICSVIGFPLGASLCFAKAEEAEMAWECGAEEIDMVMNIGYAKDGNWTSVKSDIMAVRDVAADIVLKVIIECCLLTDDEKVRACQIAKECGAEFVKTSTGFAKGGATVRDIALMRKAVGPNMGIKAAGGIRNYQDAIAMLAAGATRLGCSASVHILEEERKSLQRVKPL